MICPKTALVPRWSPQLKQVGLQPSIAAGKEAGYTPPVAAESSVAFFTPAARMPDKPRLRPR